MKDADSSADSPVDGFTVESTPDAVVLILSNRYGQGDRFTFPREDAYTIGKALMDMAKDDPRLDQY